MILNNHFASSTLANYIVWNVIQDEVSFLSKPYRDARTKYRERVLGSKGQKKRWKTCVTFTNELLGDILGSAYVEHHFSKESKKMVRSFEKKMPIKHNPRETRIRSQRVISELFLFGSARSYTYIL